MTKLKTIWFATICVFGALTSTAWSQELKKTLNDIDVGERWAYNDFASAKAAAAKSKKPILALFR